jgi:hypothetical protein
MLNPAIGSPRQNTTASGCHEHSSATDFISITKDACIPEFECLESLTATTDWVTQIDICPNDGINDRIELRNNLFIPPGDNYAYLITDASEIVQEVVLDSLYNFEGSSLEEQRVYGIHFDGQLLPQIGQARTETTATGCFVHSGGNLFLTITKEACIVEEQCIESLTATTDWATEVNICSNDGVDDLVELRNSAMIQVGENYAYLLTDENEVLQEVVLDTVYNFEGSSGDVRRVYGVSYEGELQAQIGQIRTETIATGCYIHSGSNLFLTVNTTAGCISSTDDDQLANELTVYPNPSSTGIINIDIAEDIQSIEVYDLNGKLFRAYETTNPQVEIDTPGLYIIRISTQDFQVSKRIAILR